MFRFHPAKGMCFVVVFSLPVLQMSLNEYYLFYFGSCLRQVTKPLPVFDTFIKNSFINGADVFSKK